MYERGTTEFLNAQRNKKQPGLCWLFACQHYTSEAAQVHICEMERQFFKKKQQALIAGAMTEPQPDVRMCLLVAKKACLVKLQKTLK